MPYNYLSLLRATELFCNLSFTSPAHSLDEPKLEKFLRPLTDSHPLQFYHFHEYIVFNFHVQARCCTEARIWGEESRL